jgi:Regulator of chromosome condensation (RCC1) repeat/Immunoglobulin domain/Immunoglobulin I-set domain/Ig-like domain CHU_C associated
MIKPHALIARIVWIITLIAFGGTSFAQTYTATPLPSSGLVNQYPYNFTGLITTISSSGSGAVVRNPRVVYSCAHVVFSTQYLSIGIDPWLSEVRWHRAWFNGSPPAENAGQSLRGYIYYVAYSDAAAAKQNSLAAFDLDFVVHYAYENTAAGGYAGSWSDGASILKGGGSKLITGYPSALYQSGDPREYLMHSTGPFTRAFYALYDDYLGVNEVSTAPGNSGGPVWVSDGADYYFAGVLVSGSTRSLGKPTDFTGVYGVDSSSLALIDAAMTAGGGAVAAPVITSQPVSRRVNVGQSVSLSVTATGQGLGYRWLKNGVTIAGAAAASYTVASASLADAGSYQVIVSNSGGETRSAVVTLAVDSAPVISVPPASITIIEGQVAQLTVAATGSGSLKYQWYQGQSGSTISPVSGATSATFTTNPLSATTAFWVRITDGSGTFTDSSSATVTVTPSPPKIVANPSDLMVRNGQSAVFSVTATGLGPLSYRWYWDGFLIGGEERASLTIDPVRDSNRGRYSVTITNAGGTITSSAAELVIGAPPLITVQPLLSSPQPAGSSVSLSVIAAGSPAPSYQWRKAGVPIANATKSSYSIQTLGPLDAGTYDVVLDNVWGSARSHAVKLVVSQAPVITGQPESQVASIGSTAYLKVIAAGVPQVLFQWRKDGVDLAGSTNATLAIQNVQASSAGKYSVTVSNDSGSVSSAWITLKVTGVGVPSVQPSSLRYVFPEGGGGVLNATVSGATDLQWKRNGRPISGATNSQLTISGAKPIRDNGWYQLSASNEDGIIDSQPVFVLVSGGYRVQAWGDPSVTNVPASLDDVVAISAGAYHSLAIRSDGSVASWGSSGSEVSGVVPTGLGPVVGVAAGWGHSLALRHDGTVVAWGKSEVGMAPPDLDRVVSVAAGDSHALALKADGTVVAWGYNSRGQTNVPTGLSDVETIAAGEYFSLASKRDGTVVMWPAFGTGSNLAMPSSLAGVTLISSGYRHILALKSGGTCQGWGSLGGNNFNSQYVSGLAGLVSLSAGDIHGVFLYADGRVYATGYGIGQSLAEVPNQLGGVAAVSAGYRHTIALSAHRKPSIAQNPLAVSAPAGASAAFSVLATAGGAPLAYQWRRNSTPISGATQSTYSIGQINDLSAGVYDVLVSNYLGSSTSSSALLSIIPAVSATITVNPVSTTATAGQPVILSVAASGTPTPAFQWTKNGTAIPNATKASLEIPIATPADAGVYTVVVQNLVSGSVVTRTSAAATLSVNTIPPKITLSPVSRSVIAGTSVDFSVTASGSALNYQWYRDGMALVNATNSSLRLIDVSPFDSGSYTVLVGNWASRGKAVATWGEHSAFLKMDGALWVFGGNSYGQLGDGSTNTKSAPLQIASDVSSVAVGEHHTMFVRNGVLWGAGTIPLGSLATEPL